MKHRVVPPSKLNEESRLSRWAGCVVRHRRLVLGAWLLLLVAAAALYPVLDSRLGVPDYSVKDSESAVAQSLTAERFPGLGTEQDVIVFTSDKYQLVEPEYRAVVEKVLAATATEPDVTELISPYSSTDGSQASTDGRVGVALVGLTGNEAARAKSAAEIQDLVQRTAEGTAIDAYLTGSSPLNNDLSEVEQADQEMAELIGIPIALLVLVLAFGALIPAILPILMALSSVLVCLGILCLLATPLHLDRFVVVITTMIGIGIGIDYALFVVSRFREELPAGAVRGQRREARDAAVDRAVRVAIDTSGRTILASGLIVIVALGSMLIINGHIFLEVALASTLVVACCLAAGLSLLPALLAVLGDRVNTGALPARFRPSAATNDGTTSGRWGSWARFVLRRPILLGLPVLLLLGAAAVPAGSMKLGMDLGIASLLETPSGKGQQIVSDSFSPGSVGPITVLACTDAEALSSTDLDGVAALASSLTADSRVARVFSVTDVLAASTGGHGEANLQQARTQPELAAVLNRLVDSDGRCTHLDVVAAVPIDSPEAGDLVTDIRESMAPSAFSGTGITPYVGGLTAQYVDLSTETVDKLPVVLIIVLALSFCYLMVVFRSVLLPAKAVLLNLLATTAALGITVLVFQQGHGQELLGFTSVGTLQAYLPVALFALLFGLSMDYEVFLVRRMQEEWQRSGNNELAVAVGVDRTARQITAGAAIMAAVFGSFVVAGVLELKQFGFGLAIAVVIDATLIRMVLVPAAMGIGSSANWWLPRTLSRILPTVRSEHDATDLRAATGHSMRPTTVGTEPEFGSRGPGRHRAVAETRGSTALLERVP